jgi:prepilin peptidase CpaA
MPLEQYREVALLLLVSIAAVNDLISRRIPNRLLLAGLACAIALALLSGEPGTSLLAVLAGMGLGLAIFLPFYLVHGMAAGDVKMMAVVGAFTGPREAFEIAVLAWCAGGVMAVFLILLRGRVRLVLDNLGHMLLGAMTPGVGLPAPAEQSSAGSMPYGLAIAAGTIAVLVRHYS